MELQIINRNLEVPSGPQVSELPNLKLTRPSGSEPPNNNKQGAFSDKPKINPPGSAQPSAKLRPHLLLAQPRVRQPGSVGGVSEPTRQEVYSTTMLKNPADSSAEVPQQDLVEVPLLVAASEPEIRPLVSVAVSEGVLERGLIPLLASTVTLRVGLDQAAASWDRPQINKSSLPSNLSAFKVNWPH